MKNYRLEVSMTESFMLNKANLKERELEIFVGDLSFVDEESDLHFGTEPIVLRGRDIERYECLLEAVALSANGKINADSLTNDFIYKESQDRYTENRQKYIDWKSKGEEKILFAVLDELHQTRSRAVNDGMISFDTVNGSINLIYANKDDRRESNMVSQYNSVESILYTYPMHHYYFNICTIGGLVDLSPQVFGDHAAGRTLGSISENIKDVFSNMGIDSMSRNNPSLAWYNDIKDLVINDIKDENNYQLCLKRGKDMNSYKLGDSLFFNFSTQRIGFVDLSADNIKFVKYHLFNNADKCVPGNVYEVHENRLEDFSLGHVKVPSYKNDPSDKNLTDESLDKIKDELHDIVNYYEDWRKLIDKFHEEIGGEDITYMEFNREGNDLILCMNGLAGIRDLTLVNFFPNLDPAFIVKSIPNRKEVVDYKKYYPEVLHDFFKIVYNNLTIDGKKYLDEIKEEK